MRIVRFSYKKSVYWGVWQGGKAEIVEGSIYAAFKKTKDYLDTSQIRLLPPAEPSKIILVGLNYKEHARELGMNIPHQPLFFLKPPSSLLAPGGYITYPRSVRRLDYEAELALVIKRKARNISPSSAWRYILGYTCLNDITARDIQKREIQWTHAKSFDTFCPLGPWLETNLDTSNLAIRLYKNGRIRQASSTSDFIFTPQEIVSFISSVMTLLPGDIISTGTPAGVGRLKAGDKVEVEIEGIGRLTNFVKKEQI